MGVGIVLFFTLIAVLWYACETRGLAETAKAQAEASVKMADEMREQRYDRYRPIVIVQESCWKRTMHREGYDRIEATISNIGEGPALKLSFSFDTGDKRLLPNVLVRVKDVDELDESVEDAEFSPVPVSLDEPMELDSGAQERFAFYGTEGTSRRGVILFGTRGSLVANYVDMFGRKFRSTLPVELLTEGVRFGPFSLTEGSEVKHDS
ncbi:MAG: hypothetical protein Q8R28_19445 [Dehalococcoidia bacterium]|nr:hypothetical protein [Dehalococcoidia bacterium]